MHILELRVCIALVRHAMYILHNTALHEDMKMSTLIPAVLILQALNNFGSFVAIIKC